MVREHKFKGFQSSTWQVSVERSMMDLESQGVGSIHTRGKLSDLTEKGSRWKIRFSERGYFCLKNLKNKCS